MFTVEVRTQIWKASKESSYDTPMAQVIVSSHPEQQ